MVSYLNRHACIDNCNGLLYVIRWLNRLHGKSIARGNDGCSIIRRLLDVDRLGMITRISLVARLKYNKVHDCTTEYLNPSIASCKSLRLPFFYFPNNEPLWEGIMGWIDGFLCPLFDK